MVLDAAHCSFSVLSKYFIGLDNVSGHSQWSYEECRKYVIIKVKEVISMINGQELQDPARLSRLSRLLALSIFLIRMK